MLYLTGQRPANETPEHWAGSKFSDPYVSMASSERYIISPDGVIDEAPAGWGLLSLEPRVVKRCRRQGEQRSVLMASSSLTAAIAKRASYHLMNALPVGFKTGRPCVPPELRYDGVDEEASCR